MTSLSSNRNFWVLLLLAAIAVSLPFLGVQNLPFTDHPNHMARFHILNAFDDSEALQSLYTIKGGFQPYWGMGGFMALATPLFGVERAGQLFAVAAVLMPVLGVAVLNRVATGRANWTVLAAVVVAFSGMAAWGFLNFLFTLGFALVALALWIRTDGTDWRWRVPMFAAVALFITAMHMISAAFLGLLVGLWELAGLWERRRIHHDDVLKFVGIGIAFLPSAALLLLQRADDFGYTGTDYGRLYERVEAYQAPYSFLGSKHWDLDWHFFIFLALAAGLVLVRSFTRSRLGRPALQLDNRMLFVATGVFAVSFLIPFNLVGVAYVNTRFPFVATLILISAIRVEPSALLKPVAVAFASLLFAKLGLVGFQLHSFDNQMRELRAEATAIPKGSRVMLIIDDRNAPDKSPSQVRTIHLNHQLGYLIMDRDILFPYMFSMFDVGIKEEHAAYTRPHGFAQPMRYFDTPRARDYARNWRRDFDYIVVMHPEDPDRTTLSDTQFVAGGSWFHILEVAADPAREEQLAELEALE